MALLVSSHPPDQSDRNGSSTAGTLVTGRSTRTRRRNLEEDCALLILRPARTLTPPQHPRPAHPKPCDLAKPGISDVTSGARGQSKRPIRRALTSVRPRRKISRGFIRLKAPVPADGVSMERSALRAASLQPFEALGCPARRVGERCPCIDVMRKSIHMPVAFRRQGGKHDVECQLEERNDRDPYEIG
jgi:hypothetical protein